MMLRSAENIIHVHERRALPFTLLESGKPAKDILNTWKEIAQYLNRGVRTAQRWERELALPVRRPRAKSRSAVLALRTEIDVWLRSCPSQQPLQIGEGKFTAKSPLAPTSTQQLISESRQFREDLRHSRKQLATALSELK